MYSSKVLFNVAHTSVTYSVRIC